MGNWITLLYIWNSHNVVNQLVLVLSRSAMSDSAACVLEPARLLCPRDFPGENTGVFSSIQYWMPFPPSKDLPDPGIKPKSPTCSILAGGSLPPSHLGSPHKQLKIIKKKISKHKITHFKTIIQWFSVRLQSCTSISTIWFYIISIIPQRNFLSIYNYCLFPPSALGNL